jgi:hypothetical protein
MERARVDAPRPLPLQRRLAPSKAAIRSPALPLAPSEMRRLPVAAEGKTALEKTPRVARVASVPKPAPGAPAAPFDATLGTILFAPNRQLAIIDGRIVQPGDEVRGARIVDITPTRVVLRDGSGRARELTLRVSVAK